MKDEEMAVNTPADKWVATKNSVESFTLNNDPIIVHIIKTGFKNKYIVVWEDMYLDTKICTKEEIENDFKIKLQI